MKHQLTIKEEELLCIWGLVCSESDIQLSWEINKITGSNLSQINTLRVKNKKIDIEVSAFVDNSSFEPMQLMLASNKPNPIQPFHELKNIDYIFIIKGTFDIAFIEKIRDRIKKIDIIRSLIDISKMPLKNKDSLVAF